ncbi:ATP-binding protein [Vibrio lentus]|nr:ATP-binding protein [Vibrio lentus]
MVNVQGCWKFLKKKPLVSVESENTSWNLILIKSLRVLADEDQLRSAISNLVYNFMKYHAAWCDRKGSLVPNQSRRVFDVSDTGDGIEPQHLHRLTTGAFLSC